MALTAVAAVIWSGFYSCFCCCRQDSTVEQTAIEQLLAALSESAQQHDSDEADSALQQVLESLRSTAVEHFTTQQDLALQSVLRRLLSDTDRAVDRDSDTAMEQADTPLTNAVVMGVQAEEQQGMGQHKVRLAVQLL